jgi:hypothetical protein
MREQGRLHNSGWSFKMSEYSAKSLREKMKAKARSLAGEKDQKTDSSDWTPAKPLNASVKTGARPIMKPSAKGVGESNAARDTKAAIGKDLKRGGFKRGGAVKDAGVKEKKALGAIDPSPKRGAAQHYKKGGKIKKEGGGWIDDIANALAGKGYIDGSTWIKPDQPMTASDAAIAPVRAATKPARRPAPSRPRPAPIKRVEDPQYPYGDKTISGAESPMASGAFMKKGGRAKRADGGGSWLEKMVGKPKSTSDLSQVGKGRTSSYSSSDKAALGDIAKGGSGSTLPSDETEFGKSQNYKKGGRAKRATGGLINALKGGKKAKSKGAKTDINIVINAGHKTPMKHPAEAPMPPVGGDGMPPMPPAGAPAPAMPMGAPPMPPGAGLLPPGRKAGGRITKTASSYKDMEAGAGSGEGRLQKTDIASKHKDAPARKEGGRITKVAKSYKDMEAGAASGEGRLQKTDIAKGKK